MKHVENISIHELDIRNKKELNRFVRLERKVLSHYTNYVSPTDKDLINLFTGKTKLFEQVEFALFIATKGGVDMGRCAAIINRKYQRDKNEQVGSIGFFAAKQNSPQEIKCLLKEAESWLLNKNITRIIAPWDGVNGADSLNVFNSELPIFPIPWHPEYYLDYFKDNGYQLKFQRLNYEISFATKIYQQAKKKYLHSHIHTIRTVSKKNWDADIEIIRQLFNITFKEEWECYEYSKEEFAEMFEPFKIIADPEYILIAEEDGRPIGFCFGMIDLSPLFRSFNGKLGPLQILKLLFGSKKYNRAGILGIGVLPDYRGKGVSKSLAIQMYDSYERRGLSKGSYYLVNDYNLGSRGFAESLGGKAKVLSCCLDKQMNRHVSEN